MTVDSGAERRRTDPAFSEDLGSPEVEGTTRALEKLAARAGAAVITMQVEPGEAPFRARLLRCCHLETITGYTPEECALFANFWLDRVHPDDAEQARRVWSSLPSQGEGDLGPHRLLSKDGHEIWIEAHWSLVRGVEGAPSRLHGLLVDVTPRKRAERESEVARRRETNLEERLDGFIANVPGIVWETWFAPDPSDQRVDYVSDSIEAMSGYAAAEWKTPNFWLELIHPDDRKQAEANTSKVFEHGTAAVDYRWIRKDGRTLWVTSRMILVRNAAGAPIGLRGITMDITTLKQAEHDRAEARVQEEVFRSKEESLLALSTPLVPINDELLAMPLVGDLDLRRIEKVTKTLLAGIATTRAQTVILDLTGVPAIDIPTGEALVRAARAVELLGASVVLTGISPGLARTLAGFGVDLGRIVTLGTLKSGIEHVMSRRRAR